MRNQNFTVKAILRTDKIRKDGTCPINFRVTISSVVLKLSSGQYSEESKWNSKDGFFKGSKSSLENSLLDNEISRIKDFLREQRSINTNLDIELVKTFYSTKDSDDFFEYFDKFCEKKFDEIREGTQYHYKLLRNRLKEFKKEIKFSQINKSFIERFDSFLEKKKNTGTSGRWSRHKNFKVVLGSALKNNLMRINPYVDFKIIQKEAKIESLNRLELKLIEKIKFSKFPTSLSLDLTRDMFLLSCYTGLRYSDVINLKKENIMDDYSLKLCMVKTGNHLDVPRTKKLEMIIKKHLKTDENSLFKHQTNVTVNRNLKTIGSLCKIKKNVHFHLARHTYATFLANANVSPFKIMYLLGHRDIKVTQKYVDNNFSDLSKVLNSIDVFN